MRGLKRLSKTSLLDACFIILPLFLIGIILLVQQEIQKIEDKFYAVSLRTDPIEAFEVAPYPVIKSSQEFTSRLPFTSALDNQFTSVVSASSAIVLDDTSQVVLFSKNSSTVFPMASTTKIMTALVALDIYSQNDVLTIQSEFREGAIVGLRKGEQYYFRDLLYAMLLPSGNDAAMAIAQNYSGGPEAFVDLMNRKAQSLYLNNTIFDDVTGLSERNRSSAYDLAKLSSFAIKNQIFANVVQSKQKVISDVSGKKIYSLTNLNKLLGIEGVNGIKTGFTEEAGEVLTTSRIVDGRVVIVVVMKSSDRFADTESLLSFINKNLGYLQIDSLLKK